MHLRTKLFEGLSCRPSSVFRHFVAVAPLSTLRKESPLVLSSNNRRHLKERRYFCNGRESVSSCGGDPPATNKPYQAEITEKNSVGLTQTVLGQSYKSDSWTNTTESIVKKTEKHLHRVPAHPINLIRRRIQDYFYSAFPNRVGNPIFAVFDDLHPVVTLKQNFDNLLVPSDHISRHPKESYYLNSDLMLRAHMTAHDLDLIKAGCDRFLTVGDVYRRDTVDRSHYPVFHQMDGLRLYTGEELFQSASDELRLFEAGERTAGKQALHTIDAALMLEIQLKEALAGMTAALFGTNVEYRWVDAHFPFTHPSWELEVWFEGEWMEVLGCGIIEHQILTNCGAGDKVCWAFGMGLERLAMKLFSIMDIRAFWSDDTGFLSQFTEDPYKPVTYKTVSKSPPQFKDITFWVPESFSEFDFYDVVREIGGDLVEQVKVKDEFTHPKTGRRSTCFRVVYRHMERSLTVAEINPIQERVREECVRLLGVELR